MEFMRAITGAWAWRMAWRDSRRSRRRLLLFSSSIVLGIAALVAIGSLMGQMDRAVKDQAKSLLGADLVIASRRVFGESIEPLFASIGGEQAREVVFSSMVHFPESGGTRLAQIRALGGDFPFYGVFETEPSGADMALRRGEGVLVEGNLMAQFGASVGDAVKIGDWTGRIIGKLNRAPGESVGFSTLAPRVYLPLQYLEKTGLVRGGSLVRYKRHFKLDPKIDVEAMVDRLRPELDRHRLGVDTVEERQRELGRAIENVDHYLNLVGFVALLLGGVGVASAIQAHVRQRLSTVAILRCLGCSAGQAFAVYLIQALALGLVGAALGASLGCFVYLTLPGLVSDLMPVALEFKVAWQPVIEGAVMGLAVCLVFALLPLLPVRRVSPLSALRSVWERNAAIQRDPLRWGCYGVIAAGVLAFAMLQTNRWIHGAGFASGLALAFGLLAVVSGAIFRLARMSAAPGFPFVWRQGLASLYRPQNRTVLLMVSLGLGTFLILTLYLAHQNLIRELFPPERHRQGNAVLFDIQADQKEALEKLLDAEGFPVLLEAPIVTMRLQTINGRTVEEIKGDPNRRTPGWVLNREYRSTYREHLTETEKLVAGEWIGRVEADREPVPISVEDGVAERLRVTLGDEIIFDVQGVPVTTRVASLREVDWRRLHPNFFVVFPAGVIEEAPSFHVMLTRVSSAEDSARLQRAVVKQFPNVSAIDLTMVLQTIDTILTKISFVIRFVALFTVGTGLIVLVASVLTGRYQRIQESILLRTLGASRRQILQMLAIEYFLLGLLAGVTGMILAIGASWGLAVFVFKVRFSLAWGALILAVGTVSMLTLLVGLLTSRGIAHHPPLEVLRNEVP